MSSRHRTARRSVVYVLTGVVPTGPASALSACGAAEEVPEVKPRQGRAIAVAECASGERVGLPGTVESRIRADPSLRIGRLTIERPADAAARA